ncbi:hypothetical protein CKO31_10740 [Thiohalocapsa halophila]|uniref:Helix-turn-helix domain-containing protein n=1 Tax=Thiohalocapsa halophila TaxID=69359 RepID=A0ABS1CH04_9GAMM|nr:helix-turn-helix domain-containing protein [Thiohalocapsa halophila]MBK1631206.1 hypothetical protein [Thiohalocapsa halophila]
MHAHPTTQHAPYADAAPLRPFLTERQAAAYLAISPRTLQSWRVRGGGPRYVKVGANVRYRAEDLTAWVEDQNRANTSDNGPAAA